MYRKYYGLKHKPFELAPVGGRVYLSEGHREALATLRYGVISNKGFLLLTGGVGTGKTTVLNTLLGMVKDKVRVVVLNNPTLSKHEFFTYLSGKLGVPYDNNKGTFILQLANFLEEYAEEGGKVLLIIDEAHAFPIDLLEEVRLLSNHAGQKNALTIFLIGQPELQDKLADPILLPLRQRIGLRHHLEPLSESDTGQYIAYRLNKADAANSAIFDNSAVSVIHKESGGNPRLINIICDHALITGFNRDLRTISKNVIDECITEIKLQNEKKLQQSDNQKKRKFTFNFSVKQLLFSITLIAFLATFIVISSTIILYNFAPESWWQHLVSLSTPIIEIIK
ncbi:MAG: general secretion pathway protein A [Desulforhopalus sp.]|jgi:general secretion pathway protein A